jgi:hypothetical protein
MILCSQLSTTSGVGGGTVSSGFIPESEFNSVPESKFVVDDSKVVLDDVLCGSDDVCDFTVFESLGNEFDDLVLSFAGDTVSVTFDSEHSCLL